MGKKFRSAESYYGNTPEARANQRANISPGNTSQKRKIGQLRIKLFWEYGDLESRRRIYEHFENGRVIEDVPKRELRGEKHINNWWDSLSLEEKKPIRREVLRWQTQKFRTRFFKNINRYLKEELDELSEE